MALQGQAQYDEMTIDDKILKTSHGVRELAFVIQKFSLMPFHTGCINSPLQ
jgi:hypothetical protein